MKPLQLMLRPRSWDTRASRVLLEFGIGRSDMQVGFSKVNILDPYSHRLSHTQASPTKSSKMHFSRSSLAALSNLANSSGSGTSQILCRTGDDPLHIKVRFKKKNELTIGTCKPLTFGSSITLEASIKSNQHNVTFAA
jgi:hypothetical protein